MRYRTGNSIGGGIAQAMRMAVGGDAIQQQAYDDQLNSLHKRDYHAAGARKSNADAAYRELETENLQTYNTPEFIDQISETAKGNPIKAALMTALSKANYGHVGGLADNMQDIRLQDAAVNAAINDDTGAFNTLNIARDPGAVTHQANANGAVFDKRTGKLNVDAVMQLINAKEKAKATHNPASGSSHKVPVKLMDAMLSVPVEGAEPDPFTGEIPSQIPPEVAQKVIEVANRMNMSPDDPRVLQAYSAIAQMLQGQQNAAPPPLEGLKSFYTP